ncbi:MAG: nuclear transport factor 2 family protein [Steroidobacteraceae bacterium]
MQCKLVFAALDTEFQAAVKHHDVATIDRILHDEMILVLGDGRVVTREDHLQSARERSIQYQVQDEDPGTQVVRVWGDTCVRTPRGWKYVFGQASLRLPDPPAG